MLNFTNYMGSGAVIVVWSLLTAQIDLGCINLTLLELITSMQPLIKGLISVIGWNWSYKSAPLFALDKTIVNPCVQQFKCILHVINYKCFSWCPSTINSRVREENGNWFFCWNIPSINNIFLLFAYILAQRLPGIWWICCILQAFDLNEN